MFCQSGVLISCKAHVLSRSRWDDISSLRIALVWSVCRSWGRLVITVSRYRRLIHIALGTAEAPIQHPDSKVRASPVSNRAIESRTRSIFMVSEAWRYGTLLNTQRASLAATMHRRPLLHTSELANVLPAELGNTASGPFPKVKLPTNSL